MTAAAIRKELRGLADPAIASHSQRFFKTGPGEYGEGDRFLGIRVPKVRQVVKKHRGLSLRAIRSLLRSKYHEERLCAALMLVDAFRRADEDGREAIFDLYLDSTSHINNWDIVDSSAPHIVGAYLADKDRDVLYELAESQSLWERRIAVLATQHFIRNGEFDDILALAEALLEDEEDLMHKAVGWMLREMGSVKLAPLRGFLRRHAGVMPRTMLRYAIEKLEAKERQKWMARR